MSDKQSNKLVSSAELSRQSNVSKQTISRKIKQGILIAHSFTDSGRALFDLKTSLEILNEQKFFDEDKSNHHGLPKEQKGGRPKIVVNKLDDQLDDEKPSDAARFNKARADKAVYQAMLAEVEVKKMLGELVSTEQVEQQGSELGSILINALTNLPDRLSSELSTMDDEREIHSLLTKEINSMIIDIRHSLGVMENE